MVCRARDSARHSCHPARRTTETTTGEVRHRLASATAGLSALAGRGSIGAAAKPVRAGTPRRGAMALAEEFETVFRLGSCHRGTLGPPHRRCD